MAQLLTFKNMLFLITFALELECSRECTNSGVRNEAFEQSSVSEIHQDQSNTTTTSTCSIESQDVQVCDRIRDGVNIAASLLQSLPSVQGPKGDRGLLGPIGIRGPPGKLGPRGERGDVGPTGVGGARGPVGNRGPRGMEGGRGPPGARGVGGARGPAGNMGPRGMKGGRGLPGARGFKGEKGEKNLQMSAFVVHRSAKMYGRHRPQIITFTPNTMNHGSDMNSRTGIFTCQIPGLYFFMYSMKTHYAPLTVTLVKNGGRTNGVHAGLDKGIVTLSQSNILDLNAGDRVWLELHDDDSVLGGTTYKINTFTGYLILPK